MKQDDVREDWETKFDKEIGMIEGYKLCITYEDQRDQDVEYQVKEFIRSLLASHSTSLLQKMESLRKVCSGIENDELPEGCDCLAQNNAIDDCIAIVKEQGE